MFPDSSGSRLGRGDARFESGALARPLGDCPHRPRCTLHANAVRTERCPRATRGAPLPVPGAVGEPVTIAFVTGWDEGGDF